MKIEDNKTRSLCDFKRKEAAKKEN